jgi:hypothetical protein
MNKLEYSKKTQKFKNYWWHQLGVKKENHCDQYDVFIEKTFDYVISPLSVGDRFVSEDPEVYITQTRDKKTGKETFKFKVLGTMLIPKNNRCFKATFTHVLDILLIERMALKK